jgi:hypothetical protein
VGRFRVIRPIFFEASVVGMTADGKLSIALLDDLGFPHNGVSVCVVLLECAPETAIALLKNVGSALESDES